MAALKTLVLLALLGVAAAATYGHKSSVPNFEAELAAALDAEAEEAFAGMGLKGARGRGRRDADTLFRMCGTRLLAHILDNNLCDVSKCAGGKKKRSADPFESAEGSPADASPMAAFSRLRRSMPSLKDITSLCCTDMCSENMIQEQCCLGSGRG